MLKIVNKALREIGAKCAISTALTTYVARHSFATNMKRSGVPDNKLVSDFRCACIKLLNRGPQVQSCF